MSTTQHWSARNLVGGALLVAGVVAAPLAMAQGVPPILPDNFQRFTDARFENLPEDLRPEFTRLRCPAGSTMRVDLILKKFVCKKVEEQTAGARCPLPNLSALRARLASTDVCARPDVFIPPTGPLTPTFGVPAGSFVFLPQNGTLNGASFVNNPDPSGWQLQIDAQLTRNDRYRRTVTTYTSPVRSL
jgi:hypothetical protein